MSATAILDLPDARQRVARVSVEDFHRMTELGVYGKRAELLRGIVFEKLPVTPLHRKLTKRLYDHFMELTLPGQVILHEAPLILRDSEPLPDVAVVAGSEPDFDERHPSTAELVIEVAVSSEALNRENAPLYAEAGVKEYWIVLAARRQVEVYRRAEDGEYRERRLYADDEIVECSALPAIRISLRDLFA
ncbi:MAG: Uma2 family endonuclease [Verrucomicrobiales bacterium]|nr:Uma2 family endonuclease [Verrucomicrobiales bacterium]